ncbi:MAG TPA: hypothetical protein PKC19_22745, partial [Roseiflexaceae bacterium]|nr:hypothetical protein [Roseiflexaceae bacterium]
MKAITRRPLRLLTLSMLLVFVASLIAGQLDAVAAIFTPPTLRVTAPQAVRVGEPITLTIGLRQAYDIAGYEMVLRYDTTHAEFDGIEQRSNDLRRFGRAVSPLGAVELPDGIAFGFFSCPSAECGIGNGRVRQAARGNVQLARVSLIARHEGLFVVRLDSLRFVDPQGQVVQVASEAPAITVRVGARATPLIDAPAAGWSVAAAGTAREAAATTLDLTGDQRLDYADALAVAIAWTQAREGGDPCRAGLDQRYDLNGDGCLDVADAQIVAAAIQPASSASHGPLAFIGELLAP